MSKNVLILSTSLRKCGNSETLADYFFNGAKDAGHNVEKISLVGKNISFCKGCLTCLKTGKCIIKDDANIIAENGLKGWIECFPKAKLKGSVFAGGVDSVGTISGHQALSEAYEMGKNI